VIALDIAKLANAARIGATTASAGAHPDFGVLFAAVAAALLISACAYHC
jgi:hypothetical protein